MKVALLGSGVMGSAVLSSFVRADGVTHVAVTDARAGHAREVAERHRGGAPVEVSGGDDNVAAVSGADVVVLAVKPQHVPALLAQVADAVGPDAIVVSIAAGVTCAAIEQALPAGTAVVRVMPNTPATIGQGVAAVSAGATASGDHLDLVELLLAGTGLVVRVPEEQQSVVTAISGSGPAYVFHLIDALAEAGTAGGLPRALALRLAAATVAGSGAYAQTSGEHPALLREAVSSPAGTTLAALEVLDDRAVRAAYGAAVRAAARRADELAAPPGGRA
ncbi:pyrroline-5-carboxylate reductase [Litorihabitans aurantiacus]|uniref:Pyrroline-5-carboxylate reductase n=1 Tax=Litorihabitans aurantiacus TaxID=1930061 RepID=A0AA37XCX9_9MICO|nr:pyrroline-5-carboxylate reductase [Litorihabitans aurantiacus]GMA30328.1 pyrroline-5-carboxylate reductase [Litorihabitans aurantiacus]